MQKLKQTLFTLLFVLMLANPLLAVAQNNTTPAASIGTPVYQNVQQSIENFLCTPSEQVDSRILEKCVNKLYRFGISFGAIALVFFLVFAGYTYIAGGEGAKSKAKGIVQNALIGMALLLGSYVLLRFINPNLLLFKPIQPPIFTAQEMPGCEDIGLGQNCTPAGGTSTGTGGGNNTGTGGGTVLNGTSLLLGDSLMVGVKRYLPELLGGSTKVVPGTTAIGGTTIQDWLRNKAKNIAQNANPKPEIAFVILGTNNITNNSTVGSDTKQLVTDLKAAGVKQIIWIGAPRFTKSTKEGGRRSAYKDIVESNTQSTNSAIQANLSGACYFDTYNKLGLRLWPDPNYDEIHPGGSGQELWAQEIFNWYKAGNCK